MTEHLMTLFAGPSQKILIFSLLTERTASISKSDTKQQITKDYNLSLNQLREGARMGIYTHADKSCAGKHVRILEYIQGTLFNVFPFQGPSIRNISLANGIIAVDKEDGQSGYILELNEFLDLSSSMDNSLLCPMQARTNDIKIEDVPTKFDNRSKQSIILDTDNTIPI